MALAVWAMVIGEAASAVYSLLVYGLTVGNEKGGPSPDPAGDRPPGFSAMAPALMALAFPLMGNRLVLNLLQSLEAVFIPDRLNMFGLTGSEALSVYGVLTGMALPFILFPSAITNSLSVMLLPAVAEAQALGNSARIRRTIAMALRYSLYMGILCIGVFTIFGDSLGRIVFHNASAGDFITTLAWLCPFMYLATTMGSVLNGLGETRLTFVHNVLALLLRLAFVVFLIPARDPGLPLGDAGQRAVSGSAAHVRPGKTGGLSSGCGQHDRETGRLPGDFGGNFIRSRSRMAGLKPGRGSGICGARRADRGADGGVRRAAGTASPAGAL